MGGTTSCPWSDQFHWFKRLLSVDFLQSSFHLIQTSSPDPITHSPIPACIHALIQQNTDIFSTLSHLQPDRILNHKFNLQPLPNPGKFDPSSIPTLKKWNREASRRIIIHRLDQAQHWFCCSPVLLVKKKDGQDVFASVIVSETPHY